MLQKFMEISLNSEQAESTKTQEDKNKEQVENKDLYQPVLNKTMTTQQQCVKYYFVAPLSNSS